MSYLLSLQLRKPYSLLNVGIQSLPHLRKEGHDISMLASLDVSRLAFSSIGPTAIGEKTKKSFDLSEFITLRPIGHSDTKRAKSQNCNGCIYSVGHKLATRPSHALYTRKQTSVKCRDVAEPFLHEFNKSPSNVSPLLVFWKVLFRTNFVDGFSLTDPCENKKTWKG